MKLMVFIFTLSLSFSALAFVTGKDLAKPITFYEKVKTNNSGIMLKTEPQQQAERNLRKVDDKQSQDGRSEKWILLKKANR